jgi:hypothetical protein
MTVPTASFVWRWLAAWMRHLVGRQAAFGGLAALPLSR